MPVTGGPTEKVTAMVYIITVKRNGVEIDRIYTGYPTRDLPTLRAEYANCTFATFGVPTSEPCSCGTFCICPNN